MSDTSPEPSLESLRPKGPLTAPKPEPPVDAPERAPEVDPTIEALTIGHAHFYLRYADLLPPLTAEEYDGLRASIQAHGIQQAIVVHRLTRTHIDVVDGAHRLRIAHELGLDLAAIPLNFLMAATSEEDQRALAWSLNADRRHLSKELRQARALELRKEGLSYRAIGEQLGVGRMTAKRDVEEAVVPHGTSELPETITTADGKTRPATQPKPAATLEVAEVDTAREFIIDALRRKYSPLSRGQLFNDATRIAGASGIKRAAFDAALDAMLEAGSVREHINHHGAREYHFKDVVNRLEQRTAEQGGESAAPVEDRPAEPAPPATHQLITQSKSNEWYTPAPIIEAARTLMGGIDIDPASCEYANRVVQATQFFNAEMDGLSEPWLTTDNAPARVWLNPPYGRDEDSESNQGVWSARLIEEVEAGHVREAVLLVNAVTDRTWFQPLWERPICFYGPGRIVFYNETVSKGQPTHGNALVYFGENVDQFVELFKGFGRIVVPKGEISQVVS